MFPGEAGDMARVLGADQVSRASLATKALTSTFYNGAPGARARFARAAASD